MTDNNLESKLPCAWCGGSGLVKRSQNRSFLTHFLLRVALTLLGFGLFIFLIQFAGFGYFTWVALGLALLLWIGLESGLIPELAVLYLNRPRKVTCRKCSDKKDKGEVSQDELSEASQAVHNYLFNPSIIIKKH